MTEAASPDLSLHAIDASLLRRYGFKQKDPSVSSVMLRQDAPNTFRALCLECYGQQDMFDELRPADELGISPIEQRCLEHLEKCAGKTRPRSTAIYRDPESSALNPIYMLKVHWS